MATNKQIEEAWNNAHKMRGKNPDVYRKDDYGNIMYRSSYGKQSDMGSQTSSFKRWNRFL